MMLHRYGEHCQDKGNLWQANNSTIDSVTGNEECYESAQEIGDESRARRPSVCMIK